MTLTKISITLWDLKNGIFADYRNFAEGRNAVFDVRGFFLIAGKVDFNLRKMK
jgi:hypothetical protein